MFEGQSVLSAAFEVLGSGIRGVWDLGFSVSGLGLGSFSEWLLNISPGCFGSHFLTNSDLVVSRKGSFSRGFRGYVGFRI